MSLLQRRPSRLYNLTQPQTINSQQKMKRVRLRNSLFHIRDQTTAHLGLLPANLPDKPLNTEANDTSEPSVSIGLTVGCTLILVILVSLLTIMFSVWRRKKSLRSRALDCTKSPWTQRYRDGTANEMSRPQMRITATTSAGDHDQNSSAYIVYKDTPLLEENESYSKESDIDPSFQNEKRLAKQETSASTLLNAESTTKRRTKLPDVWCSPILPMPDSVRKSPRVRTSVFQNPHSHPDVIRNSPMKGMTNSQDSSATMVGLGLMVEADTGADYTIVDDPSPIEKTGDLWNPVKNTIDDDLICSADKYAALMPKSSILRHSQSKKAESLGVMSRSPSDTSIYTAVSLATMVTEEANIPATLSKRESEMVNVYSTNIPNLEQRLPKKSKTVPSFRIERKSRTSSSRLLDEIFDEQTDARVTRTFTAAMRMMKKNLKARKPSMINKTVNVSAKEDIRPLSLRSLARRSEVRRRTKTQFDRTSALLSHAVSPFVEMQQPKEEIEVQLNHSKQNSNDSIESECYSSRSLDKARTNTMEFHLPSRLSASGAKVLTLSPQKIILPSTPQNKQLHNKVNPLLRKKTVRTIGQNNLISSTFDSKCQGSVLLNAKAVHRKSRSLDSCLSSAILGYLHTPTSVKVPERSNTGPYVQPTMINTKRERSNTVLTNNTTPLRIRKSANSLLLSKVKHKRVSQLIQTHGDSFKKFQKNNRESQYSTDGEYASPTMQVVALYDEYSTDEEDNLSTTTSEEEHFTTQFHRRSRSQEFFLS